MSITIVVRDPASGGKRGNRSRHSPASRSKTESHENVVKWRVLGLGEHATRPPSEYATSVLQHLLDRTQDRSIPGTQLKVLAEWLDKEPEVPEGRWYKRFSGMIVWGEGELVKTFLLPGHVPKSNMPKSKRL